MITLADCIIEVAFASWPFDTSYTWTDVSSSVRELMIRRGRTDPLADFQGGTLSVLFDNNERLLDPENLSGPYVSGGVTQVQPMKPIRVRVPFRGTSYGLIMGFVDEWTSEYHKIYDEVIRCEATDAFKILGLSTVSVDMTSGADTADAWYEKLLDAAMWPSGLRALFTGVSTMQAVNVQKSGALELAALLARSELGRFFMDRAGNATFHNRHRNISSPPYVSLGTFGNVAGCLPFQSHKPRHDDRQIYNQVEVSLAGDSESSGSFTVTVSANAAASATTLSVNAIDDDIGVGHTLDFGNGKCAKLTSTAQGGATSLSVKSLDYAIDQGDDADFSPNTYIAADNASQRKYGKRVKRIPQLLLWDYQQAFAIAEQIVFAYKDPVQRIDSIVLNPAAEEMGELAEQCLARDLGDRITVKFLPKSGGSTTTQDSLIEGMEHRATRGSWQTTLNLSAAETRTFWILENSTYGVLDSTTRLAC